MIHFISLRRHSTVFILLGLLVLATALRFYKLDAQSLWHDEGNSARIAERSVQLIVEGAAGDIHPPLYYLILKVWRGVFGSSEFALRSLSAVCGVLLALFAFLMGRAWSNGRVGLMAAFLISISPFAIYYSQEARMYALLAVWAAVSSWALMRMRGLGIREWGLGSGACYVVATAAGLYTQYAYPFVMVAQGVGVLLCLCVPGTGDSEIAKVPGTLRAITLYVVANLIAIALYAPWLPIAIRQVTSWTVAPQDYALGPAVVDALRWLVAGRTLPLSEAVWPMAAFGACMVLGLLLTQRNEEKKIEQPSVLRFFVLFVLAFLPLALLFAFKLYRDAYLKFLLVCLAPLCLLVANGLDAMGQKAQGSAATKQPQRQKELGWLVSAFCLAPFAFLLLPSLNNLYNNPAYARDDYRSIAAMIRTDGHEDDAVLLIAPNQWEVFTFYFTDTQKTVALPYKPASEADVARELQKNATTRGRLFVLYYGDKEADPNAWYERWLATHAFKAEEQWVGNIRLAVYARMNFVAGQKQPQINFGDVIALEQHALIAPKARPGDVVAIGLEWLLLRKTNTNYKIFVHMGKPDAPPIAQNDGEPVAGFRPTSGWNTNEMVADSRGVWIKPGTPPGQYALFVGLYDANTGQRLKLPDGSDRLQIGEIAVVDE